MLISYNTLGKYVNLAGVTVEELCRRITCAGIEVEAVTPLNAVPDKVVAAKILSRDKHPNSDHLSVCRVTDGDEERQIVCGAPNCDAGKIVPLAVVGAKFADGDGVFEIKKAKLRGVESFGMMCSAKELGIGEDHNGLLVLPPDTPLGTPVKDIFPADWQIEVEVTPNRPDWLSVWGIARDVSCLFDAPAVLPELDFPKAAPADLPKNLVSVEAPDLCLRYSAQVIRNVKIAESPEWLKLWLLAVGLRPINNVVDVTNFIMMELGQPLHAFDYDTLAGGRIVVRRAKKGEKLLLLDGREVELSEANLVICDAEKPRALAGVMGGEESGVSDKTSTILLECAVFNPSNIRATSRGLGVSTDSSYRYERGVDFAMAEYAAKRAAQLICELAGGEPAGEIADVYEKYPECKNILCRFDRIRKLIGTGVSNAEIISIFRKLGLEVGKVSDNDCEVTAPLFRPDLEREADLAEEVARIDGLDKIPIIPVHGKIVKSIVDDARFLDSELRDQWIAIGLTECLNYATVTAASALADTRFSEADLVRISNPISPEIAWMRPSLWGEMLGVAERNIARRNLNFALFEQGRVFCANPKLFPEERQEVCIVMTGCKSPDFFGADAAVAYDFYDLKGAVETVLAMRRAADVSFKPCSDTRFEPGMAAVLKIGGKVAGQLGQLAKRFTQGWRTTYPVFGATIEVKALIDARPAAPVKAEPLPSFPAISRDVAFLAPDTLTHAEIVAFVENLNLPDCESVALFDVFADAKVLGPGRKSVAYRVTFRNPERTLKDEEVNAAFETLRQKLAGQLKVELR
ncbi:MAG: phenylalanine--tRNA ligase subunit beta [Victivallaceae bacterium]|nr:phenylalanine--tRNA ligase subunit beta [Victivallaceae bacterium]